MNREMIAGNIVDILDRYHMSAGDKLDVLAMARSIIESESMGV